MYCIKMCYLCSRNDNNDTNTNLMIIILTIIFNLYIYIKNDQIRVFLEKMKNR